ncbi:Uncharacterized protein GBIM_14150 [Gryllus bimaculatus]|nr:Uncharacterized protein GBIM_14150 [Gryllus bimaculatus]
MAAAAGEDSGLAPSLASGAPAHDSLLLDDGICFPKWMFWKRRRYVVTLMAFFGFLNVFALRVNVSVGVTAMVSNRPGPNGTIGPEFNWDSKMQGLALGAYFYGYITTQILGGWLAARVGGHRLFGFGVGITAALTLLTPLLARISIYLFVAIRIIEGIFEGVSYPSMHDVWAHWTPPLERSRLTTVAYSGSYIGIVIAMTGSGILAANVGWPSVFYVFGAIGVVWYIGWLMLVNRGPTEDKYIDPRELKYLLSHLGPQKKVTKHPWGHFFRSPAVWAIIVANFSLNWGFYTLMTQLPMFMKDTLGFDLEQAGFLSALPYLIVAITMQISGQIADWILIKNILTTTQVRKLFCCFAFISQSFFMLLTAFVTSPASAVACLSFAVGMGSFAESGFFVNHLDLAPQHASVLMGIGNTAGTLPGIISPTLTGYIVTNKTPEEWRIVFYIASGVYFGGAIFYSIFASGERQKWAEEVEEEREEEKYTEESYINIVSKRGHSYTNTAYVVD